MNNRGNIKNLTFIALMSAVICIISPWSFNIPISPIPLSLSSLAIYISVFVLGWKCATISVIIYLLIGIAGLPVFSNFGSGIGKVVGPTGGYLIGYIFVAILSGYLLGRFYEIKWMRFVSLLLGTIIMYGVGTLWLSYVMKLSIAEGLWIGTIPYIPLDIVKIVIAMLLGSSIRKRLLKSGII